MSRDSRSIEQLLDEYGEVIRPISGVSMLPLLRQNKDAVRIVRPACEPTVGDMPLYRRPNGQCVLHRIVKVKKRCFIIRGDNCFSFEKVPKKWVIAVANGFYRDGELVALDNPEYKEYVDIVLKHGRPFTAEEYREICSLHSLKILVTELPERNVSPDSYGGGIGYLLSKAFPRLEVMKKNYPVLRSAPLLLPFLWIWRLIGCLFNGNKLRAAKRYIVNAFRRK